MLDKSPDAAGAELVPNKGDISAHLYAMFPPAFVQAYPDAWIEIAYGRAATGNKVNQANIFSVFDLKEAAEFAAAKNKLGFNLYAGVALRQGAHPDSGRANDDSVVTAGYGSAEFDSAGDAERIDAVLKEQQLTPRIIATTGTVPNLRAHLYFAVEGIPNPADLAAINTALMKVFGSDAVQNASRVMRLAGTINYPSPKKAADDGYVPELVTLRLLPDSPSYKIDALIALDPNAGDSSNHFSSLDGRPRRNDDELQRLLETSREPKKWHNSVRDAVASLVGRGWNDLQIRLAVAQYCKTGAEDTDLTVFIDTARKKWQAPDPETSGAIVKPVDIDWAKVDEHAGWLKGVADLPPNFSTKSKVIIGHKGSIPDLNVDLKRNGVVVNKPINNLTDVAFNVAMMLRADGRLTIEQVAAALLCPLPCNQHVTKQPDDQKRDTIERLMWRTQEQRAQQQSVKRTFTAEPGEPDWRERRENGSPLPSMHNARLGVNALGIECSYDTFHNKLLFGFAGDVKHEVQSLLGEVSDNGIMALRQLMSTRFKFDLTEKHIRDAVVSLALEHCFDPVLDLVDKVEADWDGVERLDKMVATHFNCEDTPLNRAFIRKTMIALVARARNPGCKFDTITVLESPEGQNKSTAWKVLAGDENFSDEAIIGKGSREVQEQLAGVWIHENAELAGMKKADVDAVKAYASRTTDRARAAYGHFPIWQKRHSIDVGTTNSDEYLQSQTGNRRFWPLKLLGPIDEVLLRLDRLELIGEAAHYQTTGESITLEASMWAAAGVQQEKRRVKDPWEAVLSSMPAVVEIDGGYQGNTTMHTIIDFVEGQERVASADVLTYVLGIAVGHQNRGHTMRLSDVMKQLGWQRDESGTRVSHRRSVKKVPLRLRGSPAGSLMVMSDTVSAPMLGPLQRPGRYFGETRRNPEHQVRTKALVS
jgi:Virulence-associated protein E